jgi:hypothetical protein
MKKVPLIIILFSITVLLICVFYWFQWRPSQVRKNCIGEAEKEQNWTGSAWTLIEEGEKNNFYRLCLVKNGLKPESLFVNVN